MEKINQIKNSQEFVKWCQKLEGFEVMRERLPLSVPFIELE